MRISTKGRYGLAIMTYLAKEYESDRYITLKEISEYENISLKYLEKIMLNFKNSDYFKSCRGSDGGYKLSYPPKHYTIKDILETAEGSIEITSCVNGDFECEKKDKCLSVKLWKDLNNIITDYLKNKTLEDLVKED